MEAKGAKGGSKIYTNRNGQLIVKEIRGWTKEEEAFSCEVTYYMESESPCNFTQV